MLSDDVKTIIVCNLTLLFMDMSGEDLADRSDCEKRLEEAQQRYEKEHGERYKPKMQ